MGTQDQRQPTRGTLGRETTHAGTTACARIAFAGGLRVAGAVAGRAARCQRPRWEPHHEQACHALLGGAGDWGCCSGEEKVAVVNLVHGDVVLAIVAGIGTRAELSANGDLSGEADNCDSYAVIDKIVDCLVNIARVAGK